MALQVEVEFVGMRYIAVYNGASGTVSTSIGLLRGLRKESNTDESSRRM